MTGGHAAFLLSNPSVRINYTAGNKVRVVSVTSLHIICWTECLQRSEKKEV